MLWYKLLRNHAGILLTGDYETLRWLHQIVHDIYERSPLTKEDGDHVIALAYDIRKAYEGQRKVLKAPEHYPEIGPRFGVESLWPVILVQHRALRCSLAFIDHGAAHQALIYTLEAVIENALRNDFKSQADEVVQLWKRMDPKHPDLFRRLQSRGGIFCSWSKTERKQRITFLLDSFDPMYETFYRHKIAQGAVGLLDPAELREWESVEWPDPHW